MNRIAEPILTIFTPAYNRAHTLPRTYASLCHQNCKDFIWLIVDDGSTDNTAELVRDWQNRDNGFEIQYIYKENGGMHTAHNAAYANIHTELNTCIDSDDMLADGAVEKILHKWAEVKDKGYAGIVGLDADFEGKLIGKDFPVAMTEITISGYYAAGGTGDKKLVYRTDIINAYPEYPTFEGEKYVSLAYKYLLIDQDYKLAVLNDVLCNVEYQPDGSSNNMFRQYLRNPKGFAFWRMVKMQHPESFKRLVMDCIHYCSSSQIAGNRNYIKESPRKLLTVLCTPAGWALTGYIRRKVRNCMVNKTFQADFLRMTGRHYGGSFRDHFQILLRHNLRYMWWYRRYSEKSRIPVVNIYILHSFSKKYGLEIRPKHCGKGLYLGHPYNITVGSGVVIGDYCSLHKGCTIGSENRGKRCGSPVLGDRVYVGINATIIGNIKIGNDVMIAPNSLVNFDVPDHSVVLGNPGTIHHKENATEGYIAFCD